MQNKIDVMVIKHQRWTLKVEQDSLDVFPVLHDFLETNKVKIDKATTTFIKDLKTQTSGYF